MDDEKLYKDVAASMQTTTNKSSTVQNLADIGRLLETNEENVVDDYDWTLSTNKKAVSKTIPFILLREKKLVSSNIAMSLFSSLFSLPDALSSNRQAAGNIIDAAKTASSTFATAESTLKPIQDLITSASDAAAKKVQSVYNKLLSRYKSTSPEFNADLQRILGLLYLTTSTGNVYKFPYFVNELFSIDNSFQDTYQQTPIFESADKFFKEMSDKMVGITALTEPGTYIQRPKFYNFSSSGSSFNFKFTLFNTLNEMMYLQNSNLITKLILSNTPRRLDKITVKPPCIYEVTIPGRAFYPYCFIKSLRVDHIGVKRLITGNNGKQAIIPDAYAIDITIESLISDINNLYEQQMGDAGMDLDENEVLNLSSITEAFRRSNTSTDTANASNINPTA